LSEIRATTISDAAGTGPIALYKQSAAKAWASINGTSILDSINTSAFTDNGAGDYSISISSALSNANFGCCNGTQWRRSMYEYVQERTASNVTVYFTEPSSSETTLVDIDRACTIAIHGDLA